MSTWVLSVCSPSCCYLAGAAEVKWSGGWLDTGSTWVSCHFTFGPGRLWHALVSCFCGGNLRSKGWKGAFVLKKMEKVKELSKEANAAEEVGTTMSEVTKILCECTGIGAAALTFSKKGWCLPEAANSKWALQSSLPSSRLQRLEPV